MGTRPSKLASFSFSEVLAEDSVLAIAIGFCCLSLQKKKHTHVAQDESALSPMPMTFVMERGKVGGALTQLVLDLRQVMEPFTASKLRVRYHGYWSGSVPLVTGRKGRWMSCTCQSLY